MQKSMLQWMLAHLMQPAHQTQRQEYLELSADVLKAEEAQRNNIDLEITAQSYKVHMQATLERQAQRLPHDEHEGRQQGLGQASQPLPQGGKHTNYDR